MAAASARGTPPAADGSLRSWGVRQAKDWACLG
jgi:hypothetical protein